MLIWVPRSWTIGHNPVSIYLAALQVTFTFTYFNAAKSIESEELRRRVAVFLLGLALASSAVFLFLANACVNLKSSTGSESISPHELRSNS